MELAEAAETAGAAAILKFTAPSEPVTSTSAHESSSSSSAAAAAILASWLLASRLCAELEVSKG